MRIEQPNLALRFSSMFSYFCVALPEKPILPHKDDSCLENALLVDGDPPQTQALLESRHQNGAEAKSC